MFQTELKKKKGTGKYIYGLISKILFMSPKTSHNCQKQLTIAVLINF